MESRKFKNVDEYLSALPQKIRVPMSTLRKAIQKAAPQAEETISYNMPAFKFHGMLAYYAAHKEHIGFYPFSSAIRAFNKELFKYETSKGTIKFQLGRPIPVGLVKTIVKFRVKENLEKAYAKGKLKKATK